MDNDGSARKRAAAKRLKHSARSVAWSSCAFRGISTVSVICRRNDNDAASAEKASDDDFAARDGAVGGFVKFIALSALAI